MCLNIRRTFIREHLNLIRSGFTLMELIVATGLSLVVMGGLSVSLVHFLRTFRTSELKRELMQIRFEIQSRLMNPYSRQRTMKPSLNPSFSCLYNETCNNGVESSFVLYDSVNPYLDPGGTTGFRRDGAICPDFDPDPDGGNPSCPVKVRLTWSPECRAPCVNPILHFRARFEYHPGGPRDSGVDPSAFDINQSFSFEREYRSCRGTGVTRTSGFFWLDADGDGPETPVRAYCDNFSDVGGWTLLVNATTINYGDIPIVEELGPEDHGRLSNETLFKIINEANDSPQVAFGPNNLKVVVETPLGPRMITGQLRNPELAAPHSVQVTPLTCRVTMPVPFIPYAFSSAAGPWGFYSGTFGGQGLGFMDTSSTGASVPLPANRYMGFTCGACNTAVCNLEVGECCGLGLRGSVWVRGTQ